MNKINFIDLENLLVEYQILESNIYDRYKVRMSKCQRVIREALELNIRGLLDERIFNLFRNLNDEWERTVLDILFENNLEEEAVSDILRSTYFDTCRTSFTKTINTHIKGFDPNFSIWEVTVDVSGGYFSIECLGDYRIEQWHHEHGIAKVTIHETTAIDVDYFHAFIKRTCGFTAAPAYIGNVPKADIYKKLSSAFIEYMLKYENSNIANKIFDILGTLQFNSLINNENTMYNAIKTFFEMEVQTHLEKISNGRSVNNFVINGSEIIINFGTSRTFNSRSYAELELRIAEANGDYIPERQRTIRG